MTLCDCRYGIYPLTAFAARQPPPQRPRAVSPETIESVKSVSPEPLEVETRKVVFIMCEIKPREDSCDLMVSNIITINLDFDKLTLLFVFVFYESYEFDI